MPEPTDRPPVMDYAAATVDRSTLHLASMRRWRSGCAWCVWSAACLLFVWPLAALVAQAAAVVFGGVAIARMGRAARAEVDAGYAARQVALAILLSPVLLLGVWLVPQLVESDLSKWRAVEERRRATTLHFGKI